jgi:hypothetical protein
MIDTLEYAAGLFEGEGYIAMRADGSVAIGIGMTDEDIVRRFVNVVGGHHSSIRIKPDDRYGHYKTMYVWETKRADLVKQVLYAFLPMMGHRRRAKALEALLRLERKNIAI